MGMTQPERNLAPSIREQNKSICNEEKWSNLFVIIPLLPQTSKYIDAHTVHP